MKIRRRSPDLIERHQQNLRNEMECLQSLDHPNIVKLLGPRAPRRQSRLRARSRARYFPVR
jgi:hypothetical protein